VCFTTSAFFSWWLGYPDRAVAFADRAIELVTELDHPFTMAYALFHTGSLHMWRGEMELAKERAQAMLDIAQDHGFQIWESLGIMLIGATQMVLGQPEQGLAKIEAGFESYQGLKTPPVFYPQLIGMRAVAFAQAAQPAEGLKLVEGLLKGVDEARHVRELSPMVLLKGDLLLVISPENTAEAAGLFRTILAGDVHFGGKILALQAATRLCKMEMQDGTREEGCKALAEIYDSFTEGFDTFDLQAAKAVLDELQA
jgi:hypothetical protein